MVRHMVRSGRGQVAQPHIFTIGIHTLLSWLMPMLKEGKAVVANDRQVDLYNKAHHEPCS
ncbi:hypothetical protein DZS_37530 [Dickeya ananatis]